MTAVTLGFVLEDVSEDHVFAALRAEVLLRPGAFVLVEGDRGEKALCAVRTLRWSGGVFTSDTVPYHMRHLAELRSRQSSTWQKAELVFVGLVSGDEISDRRPGSLRAGGVVSAVSADRLMTLLKLRRPGGFRIGTLSSDSAAVVELSSEELTSAHLAVVGQTGSGKTNVLRLLHDGLRQAEGHSPAYVVFDFHDEFPTAGPKETRLSPPFTFGSEDVRSDVLHDLLPDLSVAQSDALDLALASDPRSLADLAVRLQSLPLNEATRQVLGRRLNGLVRANAFAEGRSLAREVADVTSLAGRGAALRLGSVQSTVAGVLIGSVVRRLIYERVGAKRQLPSVVIVVDEAHRLMASTSSRSAVRAFRYLAQEGRKFGVTMVLATQRPGLVDPTILSQCAAIVALRLTTVDDARVVAQVMPDVRSSEFGRLSRGQGIVWRASEPDVLQVDFDPAPLGDAFLPASRRDWSLQESLMLEA